MNKLFQNLKTTADLYLKLPTSMRSHYLKNILDHFLQKKRLMRVLSTIFPQKQKKEIRLILEESLASPQLREILNQQDKINGFLSTWKLVFLRSVLRLLRPRVVVETGVANGSSSAIILEALSDNGGGRLYSIDMPVKVAAGGELLAWNPSYAFHSGDISTVPDFDRVGWLVPAHLRENWELILGDSREELPKVLSKLEGVDLFLHDSVHQYDFMLQEFETVWPHLQPHGFLVSDDIFLKSHAAIHDFSTSKGRRFHSFLQMGIIQKKG